ncbi:MAG: acyltransferase [Lachnospiraceae bacterium]|nr:acyltransferase [Lachnospiraceae bacterium]
MEQVKKPALRENGLDLLRIIAAFLVVQVHIFVNYKAFSAGSIYASEITPDPVAVFILTFMRCQNWAVPAFFMVSGAFILSTGRTGDFGSFYRKTWKKLGIPTLVFSILYFVVNPFYYMAIDAMPDFWTAFTFELTNTLKGTPADHMWYMFVLIGMYLCAPFIVLAKEKMGSRMFTAVSFTVLVWGLISALTQRPEYYWSVSAVADMLGMFMVGNVIHEKIGQKKNAKLALLFISLGIVLCVLLVFANGAGKTPIGMIFGGLVPYNPLVSVSGIMFFTGVRLLDIKRNFYGPAELTYYIYLVHLFALMPVNILMVRKFVNIRGMVFGTPGSIAGIIVSSAVGFVLSGIVSFIIVRMEKMIKEKRGEGNVG